MVNNYRPVSVLSCVSKILERHVHDTLYKFLEENNLLSNCQFGFRPSHSTETALISAVDDWQKNMDNGKLTGVLFIDLRKAFDCVNHKVLLHKLRSYGVSDQAMSFFSSYLSNRSQTVNFSGVLSEMKEINIGVPQGSILGPLFFIVHINDYPKCLKHSTVTMYADDTSQSVVGKSSEIIEKMICDDLVCTIEWMKNNKLSLNLEKTECMLIGSSQKLSRCNPLNVIVNDVKISNVQSSKLLGVMVDQNLSWKEHIDFVGGKISKKLGVLRRMSSFMSFDCRYKVYCSIVFPHFVYCSSFWSMPSNLDGIDRLFKLQKRAARTLLGIKDFQYETRSLLQRLKWMPIADCFQFKKATLTFKLLKGPSPNALKNMFKYVRDVSSRFTRSAVSDNLYVPPTKTSAFKRSFVYSASLLWNELSAELKGANNIESFKRLYLKRYFADDVN